LFKPKSFRLEELLPPSSFLPVRLRVVYQRDPERLWRCFPVPFLWTLDALRERYGVMTVNNWYFLKSEEWDKPYCRRWSGYRPLDCEVGAELSEHRFFRAFDTIFRDVQPGEVWADMRDNPDLPCFSYIQRIEAYEGMGWFHADFGTHDRFGKAIRVIPYKGNRAGLPEYIERAAA